jgi:hypothetical protein
MRTDKEKEERKRQRMVQDGRDRYKITENDL